ncbi:hypothetical protein MUK42_28770 [Musa troglodytarum]|uniref:Expansin-like CBD domain-containing protein n=1 Tax=Musa troglodytarum TaxID=320322 RepID=A0A9E7F6D5_9LILI|nr:hypothetical protein MUK42_28770 [Musa troglodytarum]
MCSFIYFSKNVDSVSSLGFLHQECCVLRLTSDHRDHRCVSRRSLSCRVRPFRPERDCDRGNDRLRGAGVLQVQYTRVQCNDRGAGVSFHVDAGSNPDYFAVLIECEGGDGDLVAVLIKQRRSSSWIPCNSHAALFGG